MVFLPEQVHNMLIFYGNLERAKGFEPSTPTLARFGSMKFCFYISLL